MIRPGIEAVTAQAQSDALRRDGQPGAVHEKFPAFHRVAFVHQFGLHRIRPFYLPSRARPSKPGIESARKIKIGDFALPRIFDARFSGSRPRWGVEGPMKKGIAGLLMLAGVLGEGTSARGGDEEERRTLYFFFSEKTPGAPEAAKAVVASLARGKGEIALRPALLVEDWSTFLKVGETSPLYLTM